MPSNSSIGVLLVSVRTHEMATLGDCTSYAIKLDRQGDTLEDS